MNKNEMLTQMQNMLGLQKNSWENAIPNDDDDEDFYEEDAIVLYAAPGMPVTLVEEYSAIDEMLIYCGANKFGMSFITDELMAVYPTKYAHVNSDGMIFVAGPIYICHPIIGDEEGANMDLSAKDFCEAMAFISTHTVLAKNESNVSGFLFEEED